MVTTHIAARRGRTGLGVGVLFAKCIYVAG
jgi:hypothetical protein